MIIVNFWTLLYTTPNTHADILVYRAIIARTINISILLSLLYNNNYHYFVVQYQIRFFRYRTALPYSLHYVPTLNSSLQYFQQTSQPILPTLTSHNQA